MLKNTVVSLSWRTLPSEAVQGASGLLEAEDDVKGSDGLPAAVLSVCDGVPDQVLQKNLQDGAGTLHTTTTSQSADSRLKKEANR